MGEERHGGPAWVMFTEAEALAALARIEAPLATGSADRGADEGAWRDDYRLARQVLDRAPVGIAVLDHTLRYRYVNRALAELNGVPVEEHRGRSVGEIVPDINLEAAEQALRAVLRDGRSRSLTVRGTTRSEYPAGPRWWHNAYHRIEDAEGRPAGVAAMILEITTDRVIRESLDRARSRLALLDLAATHIGTTLDVQRTCEELTQLLVPQLADLAAVDVLELDHLPPEGPLLMRRLALSSTRSLKRAGHHLGAPGALITTERSSPAARCVDRQRPVVDDFGVEGSADAEPVDGRGRLYRGLGLRSVCHVPLTAGRDTVGVVELSRAEGAAPFSPDDVSLATELVRRAAGSIDAAQRYTEQRDTAVLLQRALLSTRTVPHPEVECASRYLPSGSGAEVGGDWYDTLALPDGRTLLVVGDVMGHGLDAAATMAEYRATVRALAFQQLPPDRILTQADSLLQTLDLERMATCVAVSVDPRTHTATCASAGHPPPLLTAPGAANRFLDAVPVGPPLGAAVSNYEAATVDLSPGSALLLYTDGLIERRDQDIGCAMDELAALDLDPTGPLEGLLDTVLSRLAVEPGEDDVALLIARVRR